MAERIKVEVSDIIRREVDDPRIGFVTITSVKMTPDLKYAKIYLSVLGTEEEKKEALEGILSAKNFIKVKLCSKLMLRSMPDISFEFDASLEKATKLWALMQKIK